MAKPFKNLKQDVPHGMYISTLRQFVVAMVVNLRSPRFPDGAIRIQQFEDAETS